MREDHVACIYNLMLSLPNRINCNGFKKIRGLLTHARSGKLLTPNQIELLRNIFGKEWYAKGDNYVQTLYIAQDGDRFKIGRTKNPEARIKALATAAPNVKIIAVECLGILSCECERIIHLILGNDYKYTKENHGEDIEILNLGGEWYGVISNFEDPEQVIISTIEMIITEYFEDYGIDLVPIDIDDDNYVKWSVHINRNWEDYL